MEDPSTGQTDQGDTPTDVYDVYDEVTIDEDIFDDGVDFDEVDEYDNNQGWKFMSCYVIVKSWGQQANWLLIGYT